MITNQVDLFSVLREIVLKVTNVDHCIKADQNTPAPVGTYATIRVFNDSSKTVMPYLSYRKTLEENGDEVFNSDLNVSLMSKVDINFYRESALQKASMLIGCNHIPSINNIIAKNKIAILEYSNVINTSVLQSSKTEERATMTIHVAFERTYTEKIESIESTSLIVKSKGKIIAEETIFPTEEKKWVIALII